MVQEERGETSGRSISVLVLMLQVRAWSIRSVERLEIL